MTDPYANICDEAVVDRYLDGDLDIEARTRMQAHLAHCPQCRRRADTMASLSQDLRHRVQQVTAGMDFTALEKQVLTKALRWQRSRRGFSGFRTSLKYVIPVAVTAGLLIFFAFFDKGAKPVATPSAIINSFSGSMSSVMIFETPETHQTILWYNEDTDMESEHNAV